MQFLFLFAFLQTNLGPEAMLLEGPETIEFYDENLS
jgi:hypothetical protein